MQALHKIGVKLEIIKWEHSIIALPTPCSPRRTHSIPMSEDWALYIGERAVQPFPAGSSKPESFST